MNDLISKEKALKAIEAAARLCVADANHNYLMGFQDAAEAVGQVEPEHFREETKKKGDDYISRQEAIDEIRKCRFVVDAIEKIRGLTPAQPEQRWIPVSEKMPGNRVSVIICYREWQQYAKRYVYSIVIGWYARKHSVREDVFNEWEGDCDYDEDEDEFYIREGWYEFTTQGNADLMNWYINAEVVAWMPLPEPYWKEGEKDDGTGG